MARYDVTPELASIIKSTRIVNNVTAKSVAEHIGKSQSYISKLEKGGIKSIEENELISIFKFILVSEENFQDFLSNSLSEIISSTTLRYNDDEINNQCWFLNFDQTLRLIPIPPKIIDELNTKIKDNNISIDYLCERINGNEALSSEIKNVDSYPYNQWFPIVEKGEIKSTSIKMKVEKSDIFNILAKNTLSANYVTILSIVFYINLITKYNKTNISEEKYKDTMSYSKKYLSNYHFYTLMEKYLLEATAKNEKEREMLLSEFDKKNSDTINKIINNFQILSDIDMLKTTEYLSLFQKNLDCDSGFILRLISLDFYKILDISVDQKKQLLNEIRELIEKYEHISSVESRINIYD